ncbi:hypothetical protein S7711_05027 [Stachybotrys chartarum IBT 7711]|uniref:Uncharacterized protein n=1 Tax=Stachybotrys chartarum (strain CBS 109288 / IBT 7711) TaxID=1280523 RepID=A0A084BAL7_STACB|nr:hypothetical protein S7711_05027 [Stachybotrys chartarum IBT 7711]KFA51406.1 hypothetical protein S40293_03272 [Stachybotrys chartarum IBT 40293]
MSPSPTVAAVAALGAAAAAYLCAVFYRARTRFNGLPKPPHSFFWGHLKLVGEVTASLPPNCHPQVFMTEMARRYDLKGVWYLDLWPLSYPQVVLTEPELMEDVQVAQALGQHPLAETVLSSLIGKGSVATANGEPWKAAHKAIAPAFSNSHIRSLTGVMAEEITTFRGTLRKLAASGEVFSMEAELSKAIFDIIGRTVLNMPLNAQTTGSRYFDHVAELIEIAGESTSMNPLVHLRNYFRLLPLTKRLNGSLLEKVQERLTLFRTQKMVPSRKDPLSIMDLMLRETVIQDEVNAGEKKALDYISEDQLRPIQTNLKALLLGGLGTIVDSLCFTYMLLSKHPEVVQKLREEHTRVFGADFDATVRLMVESPEKLPELEYTTCVLKEAMRLFPVGFGVREAPKGATVRYKDRIYPIDDLVVVPQWHTMHYDPAYFPEPSAFRPERFLDGGVPRGWFRTFSRGPRKCMGEPLAMETLRAVLLLTVRDFDFECAGLKPNAKPRVTYTDLDTVFGDAVFPWLAIEARPRGGMMMTVKTVE